MGVFGRGKLNGSADAKSGIGDEQVDLRGAADDLRHSRFGIFRMGNIAGDMGDGIR